MLGEADVLNSRFYSITVRCLSSVGAAYSIKKEDFLGRLMGNQKILESVKEDACQKDLTTV